MKIEKQLITPTMANEYLKSNTSNRKLNNERIAYYANQMKNNNWKIETGETIKFSKTGILLDGQHRLHAIVKSQMSLIFYIINDLEDEIFDVIDTGAKRSPSDVLGIKNIINNSRLPSHISLYYALKNGGKSTSNIANKFRLTNTDYLTIYNERPLFWDENIRFAVSNYRAFGKSLSASVIGGFYAFFYDINVEDARYFMLQLCTGLNLKNNSIGLLRNRIIQNNNSVSKLDADYLNALIIKTWNCYRKNEEVSVIKFQRDSEKFPIAI